MVMEAPIATSHESFRTLVRTTHADVTAYVHRRVDAAVADDLVSETYVIAWDQWNRIRPTDPRPWLYGVARNLIRNHRRKILRRNTRTRLLLTGHVDGVDITVSAHVDMARAFDRLRESDREVLRLAAWEGLGAAEIATVLECSPQAAATRLHRARSRLTDAMEER